MNITFLINLPVLLAFVGIVIALIVVIVLLVLKGKNKGIKVDSNFIDGLFSILGGKENVLEVLVDNARLKFKVVNLELVDLNGLKSLSNQGVFVTGDYIKTLFKFDSKDIMKAMKERM